MIKNTTGIKITTTVEIHPPPINIPYAKIEGIIFQKKGSMV
jgi:hypothetical protein